MKIYIWITTVAQLLVGLFFILVSASDIQLGFGMVLIFMGLNRLPSALKK